MQSAWPCVLTITGGSSSIRFAVYEAGDAPRRQLDGKIDRIGLRGANLIVNDPPGKPQVPRRLVAADHRTATRFMLDWHEALPLFASVKVMEYRVVHGMKDSEPERVSPKRSAELHCITPYAPDRLPREIRLIKASLRRRPKPPRVARFDTAFRRTMPRVAKLLAIPRPRRAESCSRISAMAPAWLPSATA